ncbi:MAG: immunoglobulin domain-containing protein [Phycisphaerales bacterium]
MHRSPTCTRPLPFLAAAAGLGLALQANAQPVVQRIPHLPGGTWEFVSNLSDDGRVVAGDAEVPGGSYRAFRWTSQSGTQALGPAAGHSYSSGYSVSGDGLTVVGVSGASYDIAARWTPSTGMISLGALAPGMPSFAFASSRDGSTIVGDGYLAGGIQRAWKWTSSTGMQQLPGLLPGTAQSLALGCNSNATSVFGYCYNNAPALVYATACLWRPNGSIVSMGRLPGTDMSVPGSVTDDGALAFGYSATANYTLTLPFRWTAATGAMEQLPLLPGTTGGTAGACTSDGILVAGYCLDSAGNAVGCIWQGQQPQPVAAFLAARGVVTTGWTFGGAAISASGSALAGNGTFQGTNAAWYVFLGADCTGAPTITTQPASQTVPEGASVTLTTGATGGNVTYAWNRGTTNVGSGPTLVISPVTPADAGTYTCTATNACGSTTSQNADLTVTATCPTPQILQQPTDVTSCGRSDVELTILAINGDPVEYQWQHDGEDIPGGTSNTLHISAPAAGDAGTYACRAMNDCGETVSNTAQLAILGQCCDPVDFNNDGLFPDTADIDDFLTVFSGGPCSSGACADTDFNNDGLFPDTSDIDSLLSVFSGGPCL